MNKALLVIDYTYDFVAPDGALTCGEAGRRLYGPVKKTVDELTGNDKIEEQAGLFHFIDKSRYSSFAGNDLALRLRERGIQEVHLTGVCTDICVLHTAVDAYNLGFNIVVHADAVASFDPAGHAWALRHFARALGATVEKAIP
ncbi:hypothetical protein P22_2603 [Propionispora sp. 2/2-37]|uniref:cysteine hydrolase family protein n=1 Tax=Propionispora sp. 2/2-37 TaxID=1677858 RepID=UPI0006BB7973|nr:isochorismatase family cysteine hydrolase [Propionispora sp. 2/2-37]CUH96513.1 hypothetical protein P22_2603 [Propionispora sp. 2/2-37]